MSALMSGMPSYGGIRYATNPTYNMQTGQYSGTSWGWGGDSGLPTFQTSGPGGPSWGGLGSSGTPTFQTSGPGGPSWGGFGGSGGGNTQFSFGPDSRQIFTPPLRQTPQQPSQQGQYGITTNPGGWNPASNYRPGQYTAAGIMGQNGQMRPFPTPATPSQSGGGMLPRNTMGVNQGTSALGSPRGDMGGMGLPATMPQSSSGQNTFGSAGYSVSPGGPQGYTGGYNSPQFSGGSSMFLQGPYNAATQQGGNFWSRTTSPQQSSFGINPATGMQWGLQGAPPSNPAPLDQRPAAQQGPQMVPGGQGGTRYVQW